MNQYSRNIITIFLSSLSLVTWVETASPAPTTLTNKSIEALTTLKGHQGAVLSVAFNPTTGYLASSSLDRTIRLWNVTTQTEIPPPLTGHQDKVPSIVFSPAGDTLASGSEDGTVKLWQSPNLKTWDPALSNSKELDSSLSAGEKLAPPKSKDLDPSLWKVVSDKHLGSESKVYSVAFSPDGQLLAAGSWNNNITLWEVKTDKILFVLGRQPWLGGLISMGQGHQNSVNAVAFSPDGTTLASASFDGTVKLWDVKNGKEIRTLSGEHKDWVLSVAFNPQGTLLASGSYDKTIIIWELSSGKKLRQLTGHGDAVTSVTFHPKKNILASGSFDKTIKLWNTEAGTSLETLAGHTDYVNSVAFNSEGVLLASGSGDNTIKLWRTVANHH